MAVSRQLRFAWLLLAGGALAAGAPPDIRFAGVVTDSQGTVFCLTDPVTEGWSWIPAGGCFLGCTVKAYDPATETLTVSHGGRESRLRLAAGRVVRWHRELSRAAAAAIQDNLLLFHVAAMVYSRMTRSRYVTYEDIVGVDKLLPGLDPVAGEDYRGLTLMKGEPNGLSVTTAAGVRISY